MESQQFNQLQEVASRVDVLVSLYPDTDIYVDAQQKVHDMRTKYHEGNSDGALLLSQELLQFLETQESVEVDHTAQEDTLAMEQSLQQELLQVTAPVSDTHDFWKIFFLSLCLFGVVVYIWTWRDVILVWVVVGVVGSVMMRVMK